MWFIIIGPKSLKVNGELYIIMLYVFRARFTLLFVCLTQIFRTYERNFSFRTEYSNFCHGRTFTILIPEIKDDGLLWTTRHFSKVTCATNKLRFNYYNILLSRNRYRSLFLAHVAFINHHASPPLNETIIHDFGYFEPKPLQFLDGNG